jgi:hypothetical protein
VRFKQISRRLLGLRGLPSWRGFFLSQQFKNYSTLSIISVREHPAITFNILLTEKPFHWILLEAEP